MSTEKKKNHASGAFNSDEKGTLYPHNEMVELPLDLIDSNPDNEKIYELSDIESLAQSIKEDGFRGVIEVFEKPDGRYEISAGHRRKTAMEYLKRDTIPAVILDTTDDLRKAKMLLRSNINNRNRTPLTRAREVQYYVDTVIAAEGHSGYPTARKKTAEFFNVSESVIHRLQAILKLIPELQQLADDPEFPFNVFTEAVKLTEEQQHQLYREIMEYIDAHPDTGVPRVKIEQIINSIKLVEERKKQQQKKELERQAQEQMEKSYQPDYSAAKMPVQKQTEPVSLPAFKTTESTESVENSIFKKKGENRYIKEPTRTKLKPSLDTMLKGVQVQLSQLIWTEQYDITDSEKIKDILSQIESDVDLIRHKI